MWLCVQTLCVHPDVLPSRRLGTSVGHKCLEPWGTSPLCFPVASPSLALGTPQTQTVFLVTELILPMYIK